MNRKTLVLAVLAAAVAACGDAPKDPKPSPGAAEPARPAAPTPTSAAKPAAPAAPAKPPKPALLEPSKLAEKAPEKFKVRFTTTEGDIVVEVDRSWAPNGADRLFNLVKHGFFEDIAFFRAVPGFMVQFGIHGHPQVAAKWRDARIPDDPVKQTNAKGTLTFATSGKDSRTTQLFLNLVDNGRLDGMGFSPVGKIVQGMDVLEKLHTGYGEGAPRGRGPNQARIQTEGNAYLRQSFPELDYLVSAKLE